LSITVDTNVLVYAANASDPAHQKARGLLERLAQGPELLFLFWPAIMGFLRVSTSTAIFATPYAPDEALAAIADLIERPHVRTPSEEPGFLDLYRSTAPRGTRGPLVPDAHLATLMRQHGVGVIYTRDRGFRRFEGINVRDPFA
jgi:toxin-antitoxin system PIN domain toxin